MPYLWWQTIRFFVLMQTVNRGL